MVVIYGARSSGLCMYKQRHSSWYQRDDMEVHQSIDVPEETWTTKSVTSRMWSSK
jgi:hypothetical protein